MNQTARKHLSRANEFVAKGERNYAKAAEAILAARAADSTLGDREIAEFFGRSRTWVRELVAWHTSGTTSVTPYTGTGRPHQDQTAARKVLREAPLEQIERIIDTLPPERKRQV